MITVSGYEPWDPMLHDGPTLRANRLTPAQAREADPEAFAYPFPVLETAGEVDDRLDWAVRNLYRQRHAGEQPVDFDVLYDELEDYAEVGITRNSAATRRIREIVREERRRR
jgi:hypothetical protein